MIMHLAEKALLHCPADRPQGPRPAAGLRRAHNIASWRPNDVDGRPVKACVHRKGATRAFGPGRAESPGGLTEIGQPVLIRATWGLPRSSARAAPRRWPDLRVHRSRSRRVLSRSAALKRARGRSIADELAQQGIVVRSQGQKTLGERDARSLQGRRARRGGHGRSRHIPKVVRLRPLGS